MNGWRKACRVLAVLVAVGLAVLVGVRKKGEQPDETDESSGCSPFLLFGKVSKDLCPRWEERRIPSRAKA